MNNNYESVSDLLKKKHASKNVKPVKTPIVRAVKVNNGNTKKSKKFIISVISLMTAAVIGVTSGVIGLVNYFKKGNEEKDLKIPNTSISTMEIGDMGIELEFPKKEEPKTKYENPTGKVDVNKIVEKDGKLYVDKQSADKSDQVGNVSIDTKNDTLIVDKDGKVKEKTPGYEIKDKNGNVIDKGDLDDSEIPKGYEKTDQEGKYLPEGYVYADATYYNEEGNVLLEKGQVTTKKNLEFVKKNFSTTKPKKETTSSTTSSKNESTTSSTTSSKNESTNSSSTNIDEGKVNKDGTYTIYGLTFRNKTDYEQWVSQGCEGFVEVDGIMKKQEKKTVSSTTSSKNESTTSSKPSSTTSSKNESTTSSTTSSKNESTTSSTTSSKNESTNSSSTNTDEGKVNKDGTYTIYGLTFESKADYEQWVLQGFTGYAEADGIMKSEQEIQQEIQKQKVK